MLNPGNNGAGSTLLDHLDAFRTTLLWCLGTVIFFTVPGVIWAPRLMLRYIKYVCPPGMEMHYFTPFEPLIAELELGLVFGLLAALPVILFKLGEFISPGLYAHERRWGIFFVAASFLLMTCGVVLALALIVPIVMQFSGSFSSDGLRPVIGLAGFLKLTALLAGGFALVFELPVVLLLAIRFGIVRVESLQRKRPFIITALFLVAAILTPPDIVSQILMGIPGWLLFELTLLAGRHIAPREPASVPAETVWQRCAPPMPESTGETECTEKGEEADVFVDDSIYRQAARKKRRIRPL